MSSVFEGRDVWGSLILTIQWSVLKQHIERCVLLDIHGQAIGHEDDRRRQDQAAEEQEDGIDNDE